MRTMLEDVSRKLRLAGHLHNLVREHPDFEVLHEPTAKSYCFRYLPNALVERRGEPEVDALLDRLNQEIAEAVQRNGLELLRTGRVRDCVAIRMSVHSSMTEENIDTTFETIARWGRLLTKSHSAGYEQTKQMEVLPCLSEFFSSPMEV